jgi:hypothetical protein
MLFVRQRRGRPAQKAAGNASTMLARRCQTRSEIAKILWGKTAMRSCGLPLRASSMAGLKRSNFGDALQPHALARQRPSHPDERPSVVQRAAYVLVIVPSLERLSHSRAQVVKTEALDNGSKQHRAFCDDLFWISGTAPGDRVTFDSKAQGHRDDRLLRFCTIDVMRHTFVPVARRMQNRSKRKYHV